MIRYVPDDIYYLKRTRKGFGTVEAKLSVQGNNFIILKGSTILPFTSKSRPEPEVRKQATVKNNILQSDLITKSPSTAAMVVLGMEVNGWKTWKTAQGNFIDIFRKKDKI